MLGLSAHARKRMRERDITEAEIEQAIAAANYMQPSDDDPGRTVIRGTTRDGRRLKIVVETRDHEYVITVADRDDER